MAEAGETHISDDERAMLGNILSVLQRARLNPFTTKSDFARTAANEIALCASDDLITTRLNPNTVSNVWVITPDGLDALEGLSDVLGS